LRVVLVWEALDDPYFLHGVPFRAMIFLLTGDVPKSGDFGFGQLQKILLQG